MTRARGRTAGLGVPTPRRKRSSAGATGSSSHDVRGGATGKDTSAKRFRRQVYARLLSQVVGGLNPSPVVFLADVFSTDVAVQPIFTGSSSTPQLTGHQGPLRSPTCGSATPRSRRLVHTLEGAGYE